MDSDEEGVYNIAFQKNPYDNMNKYHMIYIYLKLYSIEKLYTLIEEDIKKERFNYYIKPYKNNEFEYKDRVSLFNKKFGVNNDFDEYNFNDKKDNFEINYDFFEKEGKNQNEEEEISDERSMIKYQVNEMRENGLDNSTHENENNLESYNQSLQREYIKYFQKKYNKTECFVFETNVIDYIKNTDYRNFSILELDNLNNRLRECLNNI